MSVILTGILAGCKTAPHKPAGERQAANFPPYYHFPEVDPKHTHMRQLLENAFRYADPARQMTDATSGYPFEGWNHEPANAVYLRSFTQLTAIGEWLELMANIAAGYADNPFVSRDQAKTCLIQVVGSLRHDQFDPQLSAKGLLANFIGFENSRRLPPLSEIIEKQKFIDAFGEETAGTLWEALRLKGWIIPRRDDQEADIKRRDKYGANFFDGPLAHFAREPVKTQIMALLDRRVVQVIFGDNANLSASMAKAIGALLRPEIRDDPAIVALRAEMELFLENQKAGYAQLFDEETGTFVFGWDATRGRWFGWEDAAGNNTVGHMNYLGNEFRGPLMFVALRYGFPGAVIANAGFTIQPYHNQDGNDIYTLATWDGSAFEAFGLSLFMQELQNPGWRRILENTVDIELDFAARNQLPGFLSESYSGQGVEYTGRIGISDVAVTAEPRITNAPSLYTLGVAFQIAPDKIERFLEMNWPVISGLFTDHGPWEGYDTDCRHAIEYQTTSHTLSLILGVIGSAPDNMRRYLEFKGLRDSLFAWYAPGDAVDFLSKETQITSGTSDGSPISFTREEGAFRVEGPSLRNAAIKMTVPAPEGVNLANGELIIRYRASAPIDHAVVTLNRVAGDPYAAPQFPNQVFIRFKATERAEAEIRVPFPATPGLARTKGLVIAFGNDTEPVNVALTINALKFVP
jgi:hypothetical protein